MKQIITQYGRFFISAAIVVLFFLLFFTNITDGAGNKGVFKIIGARFTMSDNRYEDYTDYGSYKTESQKPLPTITYVYTQNVYSGTTFQLSDLLCGKDYQDSVLPLRVLQIKNSAGEDMTGIYDTASGNIQFPEQGIYKIAVTVTDTTKKKETCTIHIPVIRGGD